MISLKHIAQSTLKLVDERFRVSSDQNWDELVTVLMEETNFYKAIKAISTSGNWPMRSDEFELWQTYFFMELAEYCHRTRNLSVEGQMIEHPRFMELLDFIQSLKKVTRLRGRDDLIQELIDDPLAEVNFKDQLIEHLIRRQKREELQDLMDLWEAETRHDSTLLTPENADILDLDMHDTLDIGIVKGQVQEESREEEPVEKMETFLPKEASLDGQRTPNQVSPSRFKEERRARSIFKEAQELEKNGKPELALNHYYFCRKELSRAKASKTSLFSDCATAIARCSAKIELNRQSAAAVLKVEKPEVPSSGAKIIQRILWLVVLSLLALIAYRAFEVYETEIMEYLGYFFQAKGRLFVEE